MFQVEVGSPFPSHVWRQQSTCSHTEHSVRHHHLQLKIKEILQALKSFFHTLKSANSSLSLMMATQFISYRSTWRISMAYIFPLQCSVIPIDLVLLKYKIFSGDVAFWLLIWKVNIIFKPSIKRISRLHFYREDPSRHGFPPMISLVLRKSCSFLFIDWKTCDNFNSSAVCNVQVWSCYECMDKAFI